MQQPIPTIGQLQTFIRDARACTLSEKARERLTWLEHFAGTGCSVSATCRHFAIQRMTLYRVLRRCDFADPTTLEDGPRPQAIWKLGTTTSVPSDTQESSASQQSPKNMPASGAQCEDAGHNCIFCSLKVLNWQYIRRALVLGSILCNLVLIAMMAATIFAESGKAPEAVRASILGPEKQVIYTLVPLP